MKRLLCICLAGLLAIALVGCGTIAPEEAHESVQTFAMDTVMIFSAYGEGGTKATLAAEAEVQRLDALLSRTREDSEISRVNATTGAPTRVDPEVAGLIEESLAVHSATGGYFDITLAPVSDAWGFTKDAHRVPSQSELDALLGIVGMERMSWGNGEITLSPGMAVDLGAIAKGYASDRVADIFRMNDIPSGMVSLGGNVWVCGGKPDGTPWRVAIQDPKQSDGYAGVLSLRDCFAVTSGGYQRFFEENGKTYHHIIDPATGYPAESGLTSVTVVSAESGALCDALSTALFVMGEEKALDFWRSGPYDIELVLVTADDRVVVTDGLRDVFEEMGESGYTYEIVR